MAPTITVLVLGVLWSVAWLVGQWWLEGRIARARADLASNGTTLACAEDGITGYPFRFAFDCEAAVLTTPGATITLSRLVATIQAYDPRYLIAEAEGPARVELTGGTLDLAWARLLASGRTSFDALRDAARDGESDPLALVTELGLTARDVALTSEGLSDVPDTALQALRLFVRPAEGPGRDAEIAIAVEALTLPIAVNAPIDVDGRARAFALPETFDDAFLPLWLGQGGALGLTALDVSSGDALVLRLSGRLEATPGGLPEGTLTVTTPEPQAVPPLIADETARSLAGTVANAFLFGGRRETLGEVEALALDVEVRGGEARLGPLPLGTLPPLF